MVKDVMSEPPLSRGVVHETDKVDEDVGSTKDTLGALGGTKGQEKRATE